MENNQNFDDRYVMDRSSVEKQENKSFLNAKLVFIILGIIIIGVGGFLAYRFFFQDKEFGTYDETAFFLKKGDHHALFNEEGEQLTDFSFSYISDVSNGSALVIKDSKYGIISSSGKMLVSFDKYDYINSYDGLYIAENDDDYYLLNASGKVLYHSEDMMLHTFIGIDNGYMLEEKDQYAILNVNGKKIFTFKKVQDMDDPVVNEKDGYLSISYANQNYIIHLAKEKKISSFEADQPFCINQVDKEGKHISLNSCNGIFSSEKQIYKLVIDGKVIDIDKECGSIYLDNDQIICDKEYLLDEDYKKSLLKEGKTYLDHLNYAMKNKENSGIVEFYNNGKFVKSVDCRSLRESGSVDHKFVILATYHSQTCNTEYGHYEYYHLNGEKAFSKTYQFIDKFDYNDLAKVSEDKMNYYMINEEGKQVGDTFDQIYEDTYYYVTTKDNKLGIMDKAGTQLLPCEYKEADVVKIENHTYVLLTTMDSKYTVYDLIEKKTIVTLDHMPNLKKHYMVVEDGKNQYYSYVTGKLFYKE